MLRPGQLMNLHKCGVQLVFRAPDCLLFAGTRSGDQLRATNPYRILLSSVLFCSLSLPLPVPRYHYLSFLSFAFFLAHFFLPSYLPLYIIKCYPNRVDFPLSYRMFLQFDLFDHCDTSTSTFSHTCCLTVCTSIFVYCHSVA